MSEIDKIEKLLVKSVSTGQMVAVEEFWSKGPCVIHFMRRFGCQYCRLVCRRLSAIKPLLDKQNVRLIGIGVEEFGVEDFVKGEFWSGELYIDDKKSCYQALGYKRYNWLSIWGSLLSKSSREAYSESNKEGVPGNLSGDGLQMGGTVIVSEGGKEVLLAFKQADSPGHNIEPVDILRALNISEEGYEAKEEKPVVCDSTCS